MKTLQATGSTVAIIPDDSKTVTDSGIHLGRAINYPTGQVISMGPEAQRLLPGVSVGSKVVYQRMLLSEMVLDGVAIEVVDVAEDCPHCKKPVQKSSIIGLIVDDD